MNPMRQRCVKCGQDWWDAHVCRTLTKADRPEASGLIADLTRQLAEVTRERDALAEAARAVVARWETPLWKDAPPTAGLIYRLRDAIPAAPQPAEAKETSR